MKNVEAATVSKVGKKRPEQHRIDTEGVKLFENALPNSKEASFVFTPEQHDYGIDGEIQVVVNELHTGEFFKVQIKSKNKAKYTKQGKQVSLSLDMDSAFFLVNQARSPTALIVVDIEAKKVFWHPIQTDRDARNQIEDNPSQKSITIHIDANNTLSPDRYGDFYSYFKDAQKKLSQKALLETRTNDTLGTGMKFLSEITQQTLELDGFTPCIRQNDQPMTPGTVFSINYGVDKTVDYVQSKNYTPQLAPRINLKAKFSLKTKAGREKAEAFKRLVEQGRGSVELTSENIDSFEAVSGDKIIGDKKYAQGGMKLSLAPALQKRQLTIFISNGREEIENKVETWLEDGLAHMESISGQQLYMNTVFAIGGDIDKSATFNIRINSDSLSGISQELRYMEFLRNLDQIDISISDQDGFKRKLFGGDFNGDKVITDERYQFIKALAETEKASGTPIPYPLPETISREDVNNVFWVHKLLTQGKITQDMTFNFTLKAQKPKDLHEGGAIGMTQDPPEIYLFGKLYIMPNHVQYVRGVISELTSSKDGSNQKYKARVKEAEISLDRKKTESDN
jgi:hypothetical protein